MRPPPPRERAVLPLANGARCRVVPVTTATGVTFALYNEKGDLIAESASARWLSESALYSGAQSVGFFFDLKLIDD